MKYAPLRRMDLYIQQVQVMTLNQAVAAELQQVRKAQGITQADLARLSGIPRVSIQRYETGGSIKLNDLQALAEALGDEPAALFARASARMQRHD